MLAMTVVRATKTTTGGGTLQAAGGELDGAFALSAGLEGLAGLKGQDDAGKGIVEFLHGDGDGAAGRIVQDGLIAPEAVKDDKVIEVPVNDAGEGRLGFDGIHFHGVAMDGEAVVRRGEVDIRQVGAVPAHAAVDPHLL